MKDGIALNEPMAGAKGWFHVCEVCRYEWTSALQKDSCPGCGEGCFSMLDEQMADACRKKAEANKLPEKLVEAVGGSQESVDSREEEAGL